jgi:hypothetical protein
MLRVKPKVEGLCKVHAENLGMVLAVGGFCNDLTRLGWVKLLGDTRCLGGSRFTGRGGISLKSRMIFFEGRYEVQHVTAKGVTVTLKVFEN